MGTAKDRLSLGGLQLGGSVRILRGPNTPKVEVVRLLGRAGFFVKERATVYYWKDKAVTWEPVEATTKGIT